MAASKRSMELVVRTNAHVLEGPQTIHQVQEIAQSGSMKTDVPRGEHQVHIFQEDDGRLIGSGEFEYPLPLAPGWFRPPKMQAVSVRRPLR